MLNLIIKDIIIQKKTFLYAFILAVVASTNFMNPGPNGFILYVFSPIFINYMFINLALSYDDKNKSEIALNSLPIKRNDLVIAKYISIFVFAAIGIIYSIVIGFIGKIVGLSMFTTTITLNNVVTILTCACIYNSILFPIYFKLGIMKTQIITVVLFFLIMIAFSNQNKIVDQKFIQFVNSSTLTLNSLALIASLIFFVISLIISVYIYNNKQF
ncbi:MAG TPA: ABC-2 transporter permease [Clostridiaceae bacterium]